MPAHQSRRRDRRSNADLLALVRRFSERVYATDGHYYAFKAYTEAAIELHARGTRDILVAAEDMTRETLAHRRSLGCFLLGQLDAGNGTRYEEAKDALLALLRRERVRRVRSEALEALAFCDDHRPRVENEILRFSLDPDPAVRGSLAFALAGTMSDDGVAVLLTLMEDESSMQARDWATTGIGNEVSIDGPRIRDALLRRASDSDEIVRYEALHGLARRRDQRAAPYLIAELRRTDSPRTSLFVEASCELLYGDSEVRRTVTEVLEDLHESMPLDFAASRCRG